MVALFLDIHTFFGSVLRGKMCFMIYVCFQASTPNTSGHFEQARRYHRLGLRHRRQVKHSLSLKVKRSLSPPTPWFPVCEYRACSVPNKIYSLSLSQGRTPGDLVALLLERILERGDEDERDVMARVAAHEADSPSLAGQLA